jgi:hypothetical protein
MVRRKATGKEVTEQAIIGEQGINLIQRVVLAMGCAWHSTFSAAASAAHGRDGCCS